tara:strand:- start:78 stop:239 length:162 start_codon:yes stop_codon:yes gene_type:complete
MKDFINKTNITRKDAVKKMGRYAALTALGTFIILSPQKAQAASPPPGTGGNPF